MGASDLPPAALALEDGTFFLGKSVGHAGESSGELCFNTAMSGYQEVMTDPSYAGQILVMTYPQIGNYGVRRAGMQSDGLALRAVVVHDMCHTPSHYQSEGTLPGFLQEHGVVAISDIDTRRLTRHIREKGAMRGVVSTLDLERASLVEKARSAPKLEGYDLVAEVTSCEVRVAEAIGTKRFTVVAYDCGMKRSIVEGLRAIGAHVVIVPATTSAKDVLSFAPDGVFISNGPGDPAAVSGVQEAIAELFGRVPMFGICLGHQLMARAAGARTSKLKFGHHGSNQPVKNLLTGYVEITSQNHGFGIDPASRMLCDSVDDLLIWSKLEVAPIVHMAHHGRVALTHVNLNDGTLEGVRYLDRQAFSVQYHPEAHPGPSDSAYLFDSFAELMSESI